MGKSTLHLLQINDEFLASLNDQSTKGTLIHDLLNDLKEIGSAVSFAPGDRILKKGQFNEAIYFLMNGSLEVIIDGECIATLNQKGDLVGEMSFVSRKVSSADVVVVKEEATLLEVPIEELKKRSEESVHLVYKIFCVTLAEKLAKTNVKAKNFETLNRSLENEVQKRTNDLIAKNSELTLGYKKLENMHQENMLMIKKLARLDDDYLKTAIRLTESLKVNDDGVKDIKSNLKLIQGALSSLNNLKTQQESMQGQKVLVVESNAKQRNMVKMALGGTGVQAELAKSLDEAKAAIQANPFNIIFISADMLEIADFVKTNNAQAKIVLFTEEESKDYLAKIKDYRFLSNIIARKEDDRAFNIKSISTTVSKMTSGDIFGFEKYLNWGIETHQLEICDSRERSNVNEKVMKHLEELGIRTNMRSRVQVVIEELLMNAIYDAPVDGHGKPLHNSKKRTEDILLTKEQGAKLRFATDGLFLAVSVEDPFGEFKKETIFKYLQNNYYQQNPDYNQAQGKGGAGKGLYMITENSDLVIYNIAPKVRTEVIALFDLDPNKEKRTTSLHYFEL